jgi:hypothetical protein
LDKSGGQDEFHKAVGLIGGQAAASTWLTGRPYSTELADLYGSYLSDESLSEMLLKHFQGLPKTDWVEKIRSAEEEMMIILALNRAALGEALGEALAELFTDADHANDLGHLTQAPDRFAGLLNPEARISLLARIRAAFASGNGEFVEILPVWGHLLAEALSPSFLLETQD